MSIRKSGSGETKKRAAPFQERPGFLKRENLLRGEAARGKAFGILPKRFWSKIRLVVGELIPPAEGQQVSAQELEQRVTTLRGDAR